MKKSHLILAALAGLLGAAGVVAEPVVRTTNNGNLVMEDIPEIPAEIVESLNRYQNVRSASFRDWTADGEGLFISTRFGMRQASSREPRKPIHSPSRMTSTPDRSWDSISRGLRVPR